uniref:Uncharacterized protein n=1 Tax=Ralstonia syzygii R24 TaxID=907261 RepID=G2ZY87_9RALS|nr:hypothetical protein RALSY_11290 [Ralstonia syzygii R24]
MRYLKRGSNQAQPSPTFPLQSHCRIVLGTEVVCVANASAGEVSEFLGRSLAKIAARSWDEHGRQPRLALGRLPDTRTNE